MAGYSVTRDTIRDATELSSRSSNSIVLSITVWYFPYAVTINKPCANNTFSQPQAEPDYRG